MAVQLFHPFTAELFLYAVGNVSRSGVPGKADFGANAKRHFSKVFDYKSPYSRVRYADGDWEELNEGEILKARRTGNSLSGSP